MKKILIFPSILLAVVLLMQFGSAWGPITHHRLSTQLLNENTTIVGQMCNQNQLTREAFKIGRASCRERV